MSVNVSVRLEKRLAERLRVRARAAGETLSDRLRRYAEEGTRRDEHPLITFRDGPTGRRAGLVGGPDVWEVAMWVDDFASEADPVATLTANQACRAPRSTPSATIGRHTRTRSPHASSCTGARLPRRARAPTPIPPSGERDPLRLLLDEMYPPALAEALRSVGIEAHTASELGLAGRSDPDLFSAAIAEGLTMLTENVSDYARISAEHLTTGQHHPGVLMALSSQFSRRRAGIGALVDSIRAVSTEELHDRVVYLRRVEQKQAEPDLA